MPWYGWLLLGLGTLIAMLAVALRLFRASRRGRGFLALPMRGKVRFGRILLGDPRVPWPAKAVLVVLVGYLALPFDLIPDFIPVLGQLDDLLVALLAIGLLIVLIPRQRFEAALRTAAAEQEARRTARAVGA